MHQSIAWTPLERIIIVSDWIEACYVRITYYAGYAEGDEVYCHVFLVTTLVVAR
jgi:hypothetical protein